MVALFPLGILMALVPLAQPQDKKSPVPESEEQRRAEKVIHEVFEGEYAKKSAPERIALAKKLLGQGLETKDDPITRYVLYREAREIAAAAGNLEAALQAQAELEHSYDGDPASARTALVAGLLKAVLAADDSRRLVERCLDWADQALTAGEVENASRWAAQAVQCARHAKSIPLVARSDAKVKEVAEIRAVAEKLTRGRETLSKNAEDPEANLEVGRYLCFMKDLR